MTMGDATSQLSERQMAELCALADGTLPAERRVAVEAWVSGSPELQALLERQRRSLAATQAAASEPVPPSLSATVEAMVRARRRPVGRRLLPQLAFAGAAATVVAVALIVAVGGGTSGPTVADAAALAALPPSGPPPGHAQSGGAQLAVGVEGVKFPDLARAYGWRAVGVRKGTVGDRNATVVYYQKGGRRIAYAIVSGTALPTLAASATSVHRGVEYDALRLAGHPAVTWQRVGHTCVLIGATSSRELMTLASWRGGGALGY